MGLKKYLLNIYIGVSQSANTVLGGYPDETFSSRCYRKRDRQYWRVGYKLINKIFFWQADHCYESYKSELLLRQQTPELRDKLNK